MKKSIPFIVLVAIVVFLGYFWIKSHEGDVDTTNAKRLIEHQEYELSLLNK